MFAGEGDGVLGLCGRVVVGEQLRLGVIVATAVGKLYAQPDSVMVVGDKDLGGGGGGWVVLKTISEGARG